MKSCDGPLPAAINGAISIASHLAQSVGPGAPVGLGEGAKPDAPAFLVAVRQKKWRPEKAAILITADLLDYFAVSFGTEKLPPES